MDAQYIHDWKCCLFCKFVHAIKFALSDTVERYSHALLTWRDIWGHTQGSNHTGTVLTDKHIQTTSMALLSLGINSRRNENKYWNIGRNMVTHCPTIKNIYLLQAMVLSSVKAVKPQNLKPDWGHVYVMLGTRAASCTFPTLKGEIQVSPAAVEIEFGAPSSHVQGLHQHDRASCPDRDSISTYKFLFLVE